jgi:CheY-like chemotaxis protein
MEAVGRLAGGVAHDFNNILTAINGYGDLTLRKLSTNDPLRAYVQEIVKSGERASNLTRQLLAFSRKQILQPRVLDLNSVVSDMERMLGRLLGEDVSLHIRMKGGLPRVKVDPGQIEQVLMNLAINARDAMPEGGDLTVETSRAELDDAYARKHLGARPGPYVMLAVSDTGCGMTEEVKARAFEPFFSTKEVGKGTGLGLSTVYGIVKQSDGYVALYSEVGYGTTFKVYLPVADAPADAEGSGHAAEDLPRGTETVLLVEDEESVRRVARTALEMGGYKVLEAADGGDALLVSRQYEGAIHLALTDVVMPRMNGRALAEQLVRARPSMSVLYMSGYTEDAISRHGVLEEGVNFIQKPFAPDVLLRKVKEVLDVR